MYDDVDDDDDLPSVLPEYASRQPQRVLAAVKTNPVSRRDLPADGAAGHGAGDGEIDSVLAFCPDLSRDDVRFDLVVSGSPQSTINRVLDGTFLDGVTKPVPRWSAQRGDAATAASAVVAAQSPPPARCASPFLPGARSATVTSSPVSRATATSGASSWASSSSRKPLFDYARSDDALLERESRRPTHLDAGVDLSSTASSSSSFSSLRERLRTDGSRPSGVKKTMPDAVRSARRACRAVDLSDDNDDDGVAFSTAMFSSRTTSLSSKMSSSSAISSLCRKTTSSPAKTSAMASSAIFDDTDSDGSGSSGVVAVTSLHGVGGSPGNRGGGGVAQHRRESIDSRSFSIPDRAETYAVDDDDDPSLRHRAGISLSDDDADKRNFAVLLAGGGGGHRGSGGVGERTGLAMGVECSDTQPPPAKPAAKKTRLTAEEREEQKQLKDMERHAKKSQKAAEKQQKLEEKARGKAEKQISAEARQAGNREQSLKMMRLVADSRLWDFPNWSAIFEKLTSSPDDVAAGSGGSVQSSAGRPSGPGAGAGAGAGGAFGVVVEEDHLPISNSVRWRRQVVAGAYDEESQDIVRDLSYVEEKFIVVLWTAEEFTQCVLEWEGDDSCVQQAGKSLQDAFPGFEVTLLLVGLGTYLGKSKNAGNRDFRSAVRRLGEGEETATGAAAARKTNKTQQPTPAAVTKVQVDDSLTALQLLCPKLRVRQTESVYETARLLFQFTKSIAHDPARKADSTPFSFYAEGQSLKPVKIDPNGVGCGRAWQQQLRQIHGVGHEKAAAVSQAFPSPRHLLSACLQCESAKEIDQLMTRIEVRRGTGVMGRVTHVGKDFGRQLHRYITADDGRMLIDGSGVAGGDGGGGVGVVRGGAGAT